MNTLVSIKNLSVGFHSQGRPSNVVHSISFKIPKGKTVAIVGESGSGKTTLGRKLQSYLEDISIPNYMIDGDELLEYDLKENQHYFLDEMVDEDE